MRRALFLVAFAALPYSAHGSDAVMDVLDEMANTFLNTPGMGPEWEGLVLSLRKFVETPIVASREFSKCADSDDVAACTKRVMDKACGIANRFYAEARRVEHLTGGTAMQFWADAVAACNHTADHWAAGRHAEAERSADLFTAYTADGLDAFGKHVNRLVREGNKTLRKDVREAKMDSLGLTLHNRLYERIDQLERRIAALESRL